MIPFEGAPLPAARRRRPEPSVQAVGLACIGKEAHLLDERNLVAMFDELQSVSADPHREPRTVAVLPRLQAIAVQSGGIAALPKRSDPIRYAETPYGCDRLAPTHLNHSLNSTVRIGRWVGEGSERRIDWQSAGDIVTTPSAELAKAAALEWLEGMLSWSCLLSMPQGS